MQFIDQTEITVEAGKVAIDCSLPAKKYASWWASWWHLQGGSGDLVAVENHQNVAGFINHRFKAEDGSRRDRIIVGSRARLHIVKFPVNII